MSSPPKAGVSTAGTSKSPPRSPPTVGEGNQSEGLQPGQIDTQDVIEADENIEHDDDADSALGDEDTQSFTASLASSVLAYKYENGRRYHAFREGQYLFPNDDVEQERLDMLHHIFRMLLGGELYEAPVGNLHKALDFGTGTGIWAIELADEVPTVEVIGTDLSPIQPEWVPQNCVFLVDDVESPWLENDNDSYDLIHGRNMVGSIGDWDKLFVSIKNALKPGTGWVEMQEMEVWFHSERDALTQDSSIMQWQQHIDTASSSFGKQLNCAASLKQKVIDAGFVDVTDHIIKIPIGTWAKDPNLKHLGRFLQANILDSIEPVSLAYCTRVLQWSELETKIFIAKVRQEFLKANTMRLWVYCHILYGRRAE